MATWTKAESCGCTIQAAGNGDGFIVINQRAYAIHFCPLHREAAALVAFVRRIVAHARHGADLTARDYQEARALLRRVE